jgi:hypothetical protein
MTVVYDSAMHRTFGLCVLDESDMERFLGRIECAQRFAPHPLLSPTILFGMEIHDLRSMGADLIQDCKNMLTVTGYNDEDDEVLLDQMADPTQIPQRLNVLSGRIAGMGYYCSVIIRALDLLETELRSLPSEHYPSVSLELQEQMVYFREATLNISFVSERGKSVVQSMVQTVCILFTYNHERLRLRITGVRKPTTARQPAQSPLRCRHATHHRHYSYIPSWNLRRNLL